MTAVIECNHVSKRYRLGAGRDTLRERISGLVRWGHGGSKDLSDRYELWALRDVSFAIGKGDTLGIIGPNGSGKTTTLKLLSNVIKPTTGRITVRGRFAALIELGAGFHPDLTGRENIYLNGSIMGLRRREIEKRFDAIVAFSELERFIDTPVKRYSSGMYARLGFAVAAHVEPDALLVDEVLSVGDMAFQAKCYKRMDELRNKGTTLVFVSHNLGAVQKICRRAIVLYRGRVAYEGPSSEAVAEYATILRSAASPLERPAISDGRALAERRMTHGAKITKVTLLSSDGVPIRVVQSGDPLRVCVEVEFFEDAPSPIFACTIRSENGDGVYDTTTREMGIATPNFRAGQRVIVEYNLHLHLLDGIYDLATDLAYADLSCYYDYVGHAASFVVVGGSHARGIANLHASVSFSPLSLTEGDANSAVSAKTGVQEPIELAV